MLAFLLLVDENGPIPYLKMAPYTPMGSREKGKCRKEGSPNQRVYKLGLRELENREQWDRKSSRECRYRFPGKRKGNLTEAY